MISFKRLNPLFLNIKILITTEKLIFYNNKYHINTIMTYIEYPTCNKSLVEFINSNDNYKNIYNILNPVLFDTTLRDGLQNVKLDELEKYSTFNKIKLYEEINKKYEPKFIEIGSLVSNKYFPIFSDSIEIFSQLYCQINNNFLLIPSLSKLNLAIDNGCTNFSFISSVSETFQLANTNKSLHQTKNEILEMIHIIKTHHKITNPKIKIYLSCIDHCPKEGKISSDLIVDEIIYYHNTCKPDFICLSDTCASLTFTNFINIVDRANEGGVCYSKFSLHLHIDNSKSDYYSKLQKIFNASMDRKITHFDISMLETGGCTMTLGHSNTKPNLTYQLYYQLLIDYIVNNTP